MPFDYHEFEAHLRAAEDLRESISTFLEGDFLNLTTDEAEDAILTIMDVIYDDLEGDELYKHHTTARSTAVVDKVKAFDATRFARKMKERGLLWVEDGEPVGKGTFAERIKIMAENQAKAKAVEVKK